MNKSCLKTKQILCASFVDWPVVKMTVPIEELLISRNAVLAKSKVFLGVDCCDWLVTTSTPPHDRPLLTYQIKGRITYW